MLWEQNQGLIDCIVRGLTGLQNHEEGFEDAKQQAYFGLLEAVERYRPGFGVKFFSYAGGRIRKAIYRYHANIGYVVRVPEYLRLRMRKYARFCQEYKTDNGVWPDDETCMGSLRISKKGLEHLKKLNRDMSVMSLEEKAGEEGGHTLGDTIPDGANLEEIVTGSVYKKELHETLSKALCLLPPGDMKELGQQGNSREKAGYERKFQLLSLLLEHYRGYPAGSRGKGFIDHIMERHRLAYREGITEDFYKVRHNMLVCRFILSKPMVEGEICQRMGVKKAVYEKNIRKGIEELMVYAFGVDGLPPW